jgi:diadenosine tetraphosphate (Ap4A) HIT family hydrolase
VTNGCIFCEQAAQLLAETVFSFAVKDRFPSAAGHCLVVPKRHLASVFDLSREEYLDLWRLVFDVRALLCREEQVSAFTIGVNDGAASGQTILHAHVHIIPRRSMDTIDPRGGIRWVLPSTAKYWVD